MESGFVARDNRVIWYAANGEKPERPEIRDIWRAPGMPDREWNGEQWVTVAAPQAS